MNDTTTASCVRGSFGAIDNPLSGATQSAPRPLSSYTDRVQLNYTELDSKCSLDREGCDVSDDQDAEPGGSFIRWQQYRIEQFGTVTNLLIGLGTGALALEVPLAIGKDRSTGVAAVFIAASAGFLFLSVAVGLVLAWNRLRSFRLTAQKARKRENGDATHAELAAPIDALDKRSWRLLCWQTWLFGIGGFAIAALVIAEASCALHAGGGGASELPDAADEAGASDGASPLIWVLSGP